MLESFFRSYIVSAGSSDEPQYDIMNKLAKEEYENGKKSVDVDVSFLGKRSDPDHRGSINNIGRENFTPSAFVLGVLNGMCNELHGLYKSFGDKKAHIVASGGAVRKNEILRNLLSDRFGMKVYLNGAKEEAALGVALFSAFVTQKITYVNGFSEHIHYKS
jgi:sugar (pentulose or hexulose) kinase